jgi:hypothetical protein
MTVENVLEALRISDAQEVLSPFWESSCASYRPPKILNDMPRLLDIADYCGLTVHEATSCADWAVVISKSEAMSCLFYHIFRLIFETPAYEKKNYNDLPMLPDLGKDAGVFYLLMVLGIADDIRAFHRERNIPEKISKETLLDVKINVTRYARACDGHLGVLRGVLPWFEKHNEHLLYRLGRLQFHYTQIGGDVTVYRHNADRRIVAFSKAGVIYTKEGFWAVDGKEDSLSANWVSEWSETEKTVSGNPIAPTGHAQSNPITLNKEEWSLELSEGCGVLDTHIPEGGGMTVDACIASMNDAVAFFGHYFPDRNTVAFTCRSWIFSPQYDELYRPDANFVLFQKEVFLFPTWSSGKEGLFFVFDTEEIDLDTIKTKTSLQRAMVSHLKSGGVLRAGGMFFLFKDIDQLGCRHYRSEQ